MSAPAADFAALEDAIVALLQAAVAGMRPAVSVLTAADLAGVSERAQLAPALHVIDNGFVPQPGARPHAVVLAHEFYVVAVARNAADQRGGRAARAAAGPLAACAMAALLSETLPGATTPLALTRAPAPAWRGGVYYLPTAWAVETVFRKRA